MNQMMVATKSERILRIRWDGAEERDFSLDLKRIPFSINQQVSYGEWKAVHTRVDTDAAAEKIANE